MNLLALALQAIDDPSALPVLGDAALEAGWDESCLRHVDWHFVVDGSAMAPTVRWAWAVAAWLLFGEWSSEPWPLITRMQIRAYREAIERRLAEYGAMGVLEYPERITLDPIAEGPAIDPSWGAA